jgi:RNA polymerase sigma-70 factor (ECF subfamily)
MSAKPAAELKVLSERARAPLRRYFERRIRGRGNADAEDLVQEVFLRLARADDGQTIENIDGYVCRIAANLARDYVRRIATHRNEMFFDVNGILRGDDFSPERILLGRETLRQMFSLLDELPEKTKTIFLLYHAEVMPQCEIARKLQIPVSTIQKHMCRANKHLCYKLEMRVEN